MIQGSDVYVQALAYDVGSRTDLMRTVEDLRDLPKVRGIIHGALYLRSNGRMYADLLSTDHAQGCFIYECYIRRLATGHGTQGHRSAECIQSLPGP